MKNRGQGTGIRGQLKPRQPGILAVQILEARPNTMFSEEQRAAVRFLRFNQWLPCRECGRRRKVMWTMLSEFYAHSMGAGSLGIQRSAHKHPPLDAVCGDHLLAPAWPEGGARGARTMHAGEQKKRRRKKP